MLLCVASFSSAALSASSPISYDECVVHSSTTWGIKTDVKHYSPHAPLSYIPVADSEAVKCHSSATTQTAGKTSLMDCVDLNKSILCVKMSDAEGLCISGLERALCETDKECVIRLRTDCQACWTELSRLFAGGPQTIISLLLCWHMHTTTMHTSQNYHAEDTYTHTHTTLKGHSSGCEDAWSGAPEANSSYWIFPLCGRGGAVNNIQSWT